jgi:hypothetical protein
MLIYKYNTMNTYLYHLQSSEVFDQNTKSKDRNSNYSPLLW